MRPDSRIGILKLFRHFGHLISDIFLNYEENIGLLSFSFRPYIETYVAEYCSKTLSHLKLNALPRMLFDDNAVQFTNVSSMDVYETYLLTVSAVPFTKCFPNVQSLTWDTTSENSIRPESITVGIQSVRHLNISNGLCSRSCRCNAIIKLLQLNPQLTKLEFYHDSKKCSMPILPRIPVCLPELETLTLTLYECETYEQTVHFKNVIEFKLNLFRHCRQIPFTFDKLKSLTVTYYSKETQAMVSKFIARNENLTTLNVYYSTTSSHLIDMIPVLSHIEDLTITDFSMPSSGVIHRLLTEIRSLKKLLLVVRNHNPSELNGLVQSHVCEQEKRDGLFHVAFQPWKR